MQTIITPDFKTAAINTAAGEAGAGETGSIRSNAAFHIALGHARCRASYSYFAQHVIVQEEGGYVAIDEGDYGALLEMVAARIVHTVPAGLLDEE